MQTHTLTREEIETHDPAGGNRGRWLCPLPECGEHTDPRRHRSLSLVPETGLWHCHRCHAQGQLKDRWKPFERKNPKERSQEEQKRRRVGLAKILAKAKGEDKQEAVSPERYRLGTLGCLQASRSALAYLEGRGFKGEEALELLSSSGVRFAPDFGRREATEEVKASHGTASVIFPLRDDKKRLVASQGRFLKPWERDGKVTQKFLTLGDKDAGVFASAGALEALQKGAPVAIVEAPFDALSLALAGLPALALCGSSGVPEWLTRKAFGRRFLLAFDADQAGDAAAERLGLEISTLGGIVERLRPEGAKDWNELLQMGGVESLLPSPETPSTPEPISLDILDLAASANAEDELLRAHYSNQLPREIRPAIICPSGRVVGNLACAVAGILQRREIAQSEGVVLSSSLVAGDEQDWCWLVGYWSRFNGEP